jgi:hypothetical protein
MEINILLLSSKIDNSGKELCHLKTEDILYTEQEENRVYRFNDNALDLYPEFTRLRSRPDPGYSEKELVLIPQSQ